MAPIASVSHIPAGAYAIAAAARASSVAVANAAGSASGSTADAVSGIRLRVLLEGPHPFWLRMLVVMLYATLMSLIGHTVLCLIASVCHSVSSAVNSFRQRPIRLDEYSEVPQSSTAVERFEEVTAVLLPRVDCCCDRCPTVEKA